MKNNLFHIVREGLAQARFGVQQGHGGPFGAVIYKTDTKEMLCSSHNHVLAHNDPSAHAEIMAIRKACQKLGTPHLKGYSLYATGEPCPMCHAAMFWAQLDSCVYCTTYEEAAQIGFGDDEYGKMMNGQKPTTLPLIHVPNQETLEFFLNYQGQRY